MSLGHSLKLTEALDGLGRPVAYYPELARFLGSVDAAILFCQLFYWRDKALHNYTFKKSAELETETGLSIREQRKARDILTASGIIDVQYARLQHELRFTINERQLDDRWHEWLQAGKPDYLKLSRRTVSKKLARGEKGRFERRPAVAPNTVRRTSGTPPGGRRSHRLPA